MGILVYEMHMGRPPYSYGKDMTRETFLSQMETTPFEQLERELATDPSECQSAGLVDLMR